MSAGGPAPDDLLEAGREERPPRRGLRLAAGLVAALAVVAVLRPDLASLSPAQPGHQADRPADHSPYSSSRDNALVGVLWPTRGNLADDRGFVAAAVEQIARERADVARVFFAGRLTDGSRLLLAGSDVLRGVVATSVHALHVRPGQPPELGEVSNAAALVDGQEVLGWAVRGVDERVRVVTLARPGPVRFELSPQVDFHPVTGAPDRHWLPVTSATGVAVTDLGPDTDPVIGVRAEGPGVFRLPFLVQVPPRARPAPATRPLTVLGVLDAGYRGPDPEGLVRGLAAQAGAVVDLQQAAARVLWSGAPWKQRRLALVLLVRPDGQRFQALVGEQDGTVFPAGVRALPADAPSRLPWLLEPFSPQDPTLLICPSGDGTLTYRRPGRPATTLRIGSDGVVVAVPPGPSPPRAGGAEVTVRNPGGRVLIRTTLPMTGYDNPLALH